MTPFPFPTEIRDISLGKGVNRISKLLNLRPFIDNEEILRVDGRLANFDLNYTKEHPAIIFSERKLT